MSGGMMYFGELIAVVGAALVIAACALAVGYTAYRKENALVALSRRLLRRADDPHYREGDVDGIARINLLVLSGFLLWVSMIVCITGLRVVLA